MLAMNNINPDLKTLGTSFKREKRCGLIWKVPEALLRYLLWGDVNSTNLLAPGLLATEFW